MRILLTTKQSKIRELNRSLRGKIRLKWIYYAANQVDRLRHKWGGSITPPMEWIHSGAN
ncbi:uncharacterized protein METZ01_LOCUS111457 [marine metagenome]|uniref:Uncharacterized protein n=1 Tax=marine metagenome TaxID=408172 RepID=A0A381X306_9ZZZZ